MMRYMHKSSRPYFFLSLLALVNHRPPSELLGTVTSSSPFFGDFNSAEKANKSNRDSAKVHQHLYHWALAAKHWNVLPDEMEPMMASVPNRTSSPTTTAVGAAAGASTSGATSAALRSARASRNRRSRSGKRLNRAAIPRASETEDEGSEVPDHEYDEQSDDGKLLLFDPSALENYSSGSGADTIAKSSSSSSSSEKEEVKPQVKVGSAAELSAATAEWDLQQQQSKNSILGGGSSPSSSWESVGPLLRDRAIEAAKQRQPRIIAIGDVHGYVSTCSTCST